QQARQVVRLRARIASQRGGAYDRAEVEAATGIRVPSMPEGWSVRDVQVFPARHGTGIEVAVAAGPFGEVSLFATHRRSIGQPNEIAGSGEDTTIYWTAGGSSYALSGSGDEATLRRAVAMLAGGSTATR
ncbi:anti-sigma factor, partial [Methylobacterium trifolii]